MRARCLHIALVLLMLAQPAAAAVARTSMLASGLDAAGDAPVAMAEMPGCHQADRAPVADCCDGMSAINCGMDCGTPSPAISQPQAPARLAACGDWPRSVVYAVPFSPPPSPYKPPRTS